MENIPASARPSAAAAWKVPRSKAHHFNQQIKEKILEAIEPALFGDYWDFPSLLLKFEDRFSQYIGLEHVAAVQSGTAALILALKAAGLQSGDEVITVANSDMSTTSAIVNCGAKPVFCDILASDYTINPELVESLISERTRGLLPVDLYGHPANIKQLQHIARQHSLFIVEDAALATTQAAKQVWWISTSDTAGEDERYGTSRLISFEITENVNEASTFSITLAGIGAYTLAVGA